MNGARRFVAIFSTGKITSVGVERRRAGQSGQGAVALGFHFVGGRNV